MRQRGGRHGHGSEPSRLGEGVRRALDQAGTPGAGALPRIVDAWPAAVGDAIARAAWPLRIGRDGTLHVATVSSTWAFELGRLAPDLLATLRTALGDDAPPALRFAPGPLPARGAPPPEELPAPPPVGPEERLQGAELAAGIEDPELRELVARAAAASLSAARSGRPF